MNENIRLASKTQDGMIIDFDRRVYSQQAVKKSLYKFGDRCSAKLDLCSPDTLRVTVVCRRGVDPDTLIADIAREVLDQDLRESIAKETEPIRNLILAQAFSATSLLAPQSDTADYQQDPQGIGKSGQ